MDTWNNYDTVDAGNLLFISTEWKSDDEIKFGDFRISF